MDRIGENDCGVTKPEGLRDTNEHGLSEELPMPMAVETEEMDISDPEEVEMENLAVEMIPDIDSCDSKDPLAAVDYVEEIYSFYRQIEVTSCVGPDYMSNQFDINEKMRAILIDWLIEVHYKFELMDETLFLTINIIDRFLERQTVLRKKLQLVGVTAMLLACKYEEVSVPVVEDLILISDRAYTRNEVLAMEKLILKTLQFNMSVPTPYVFMRRFLKAAQSDVQLELLSFFIIELCLVEYKMLKFRPSLLAAAAIYTAQCTLKGFKHWNKTCELHTTFPEGQLLECSMLMVGFHLKAGTGKLTGVHRKYSTFKDESMAAAVRELLLSFSSASLLLLLLLLAQQPLVSSLNVITHLPGFEGPLPFHLETGYVDVDEANGVQLFYYFIRSERKPADDPLTVWITGGPGCSAFSGLMFEIDGRPLHLFCLHPVNAFMNWNKSSSIHATGNEAGDGLHFNLKGYLVGNPSTDGEYDGNAIIPYAHGMGLISDELYEATKRSCGEQYQSPRNAECASCLQAVNQGLFGINNVHILEPLCFFASPKRNILTADRRKLLEEHLEQPLSKSDLPLQCRSSGYVLSYFWTNNDTVREALGVREGTKQFWVRCNYGINYTNDVPSSLKYHLSLTSRGYRALAYSGDHDMTVPFLGTQAWIRSLNFSIVDDWRSWFVDGQVAGFTRTYSNNLTFVTIKGGGHTAPEYKPKECLAMVDRWFAGSPL
ncbi:hypothetical protein C4D60_Mb11t20160 [Musa balbisiana]|uniref:Uncharacterized protein n=1 Tax=Musa balbisiana TaxID=52838 RepID=A0A4S8J5F7_MUSBA|nr:hypothetical protein C4D60_Mb11t20160 [Musa balbisiana]